MRVEYGVGGATRRGTEGNQPSGISGRKGNQRNNVLRSETRDASMSAWLSFSFFFFRSPFCFVSPLFLSRVGKAFHLDPTPRPSPRAADRPKHRRLGGREGWILKQEDSAGRAEQGRNGSGGGGGGERCEGGSAACHEGDEKNPRGRGWVLKATLSVLPILGTVRWTPGPARGAAWLGPGPAQARSAPFCMAG